jgi:hypothetical protein
VDGMGYNNLNQELIVMECSSPVNTELVDHTLEDSGKQLEDMVNYSTTKKYYARIPTSTLSQSLI